MLKRFWPASLLVSTVLIAVAVSPLRAADDSSYSQLVTRARGQQSLADRRMPVTTPACPGDDDMPDRTALPRSGGLPTANGTASTFDPAAHGWNFQAFWTQIREQALRVLFRFRA